MRHAANIAFAHPDGKVKACWAIKPAVTVSQLQYWATARGDAVVRPREVRPIIREHARAIALAAAKRAQPIGLDDAVFTTPAVILPGADGSLRAGDSWPACRVVDFGDKGAAAPAQVQPTVAPVFSR